MTAFEQNNPDVTILRYDGDEIDFVQNKQHLNRILSEVQESMLKRSM
jgi:deoxyguanosine kinase